MKKRAKLISGEVKNPDGGKHGSFLLGVLAHPGK